MQLWTLVIKDPIAWLLAFLYSNLQSYGPIQAIGAYGVAIVILTIAIRLPLVPLQWWQLRTQRKSAAEQRKLAPEVAEIRKKYKKDTARIQQETMKLYQEHGINPLAGLWGCLPLLIQLPILTALYYVFQDFAHHAHQAAPFLFIPNLDDTPRQHAIFTIAGLIPVPTLPYAIFPLLAAITTFIQARMLQMPLPPNPTEQELQTANMSRQMMWLSPVIFAYFTLNVPAGLGLYWFVGNVVSIIAQSFVVGWGSLIPKSWGGGASALPATPKVGGGPTNGPRPTLKPAPQNGRPRRPKK